MRSLLLASVLTLFACRATAVVSPLAAPSPEEPAPPSSQPAPQPGAFTQEGLATYYADSLHGRKTASGEPYDKEAMTCAHKKLPFGTSLLVESLTNGRSVTVRVNDRGPFSETRIIDVSRAAAEQLDLIRPGKMKVKITVLEAAPTPKE